jgi:hypothetical protein
MKRRKSGLVPEKCREKKKEILQVRRLFEFGFFSGIPTDLGNKLDTFRNVRSISVRTFLNIANKCGLFLFIELHFQRNTFRSSPAEASTDPIVFQQTMEAFFGYLY